MADKVPVIAVLRATQVLELVSHYGRIGVRELARHLLADASTVHRTLLTLEAANFVSRDTNGKFFISQHLGQLTERGYFTHSLAIAAEPHLRELHQRIGETVLLAVPDGTDLIYIQRIPTAVGSSPASQELEVASRPGYRVPMHATAGGKAFLAALPASERRRLLDQLILARVTVATITDRRQLEAELATTKERGWAINAEEFRPGIAGVGACIRKAAGPVGVLALVGPVSRMTADRIAELGPVVAGVAKRISREQGWQPSANP